MTDDAATLPHAMQSLIRRAATLTVECERAEAAYAKDNGAKPADLEAYQRTTNTLYRLLGSLQVKAGLTEHLSRPLSRAPLTQGDSRFIRQVHSTFTVSDWRIAYGDDDAAVTRAFARSLLFSIEEAKHKGTPVPATLATFAIDNGIAEYADDQSPQTIDHEGRSAVSAIPIANDNTGCLQHADD